MIHPGDSDRGNGPVKPPQRPEGFHVLLARYSIQRWRHGELGMLPVVLGLILIAVYFQSQQPTFLSARNISNLIVQIAATGSVAVGIVMVLLLGEIDLSVGSVAGLCSAVLGVLIVNNGWPWWLAILAVLGTGAAIGAFQGSWFAFTGVPSFVVTLAGFLAWQGVQLRVLGSTGTVNVFEPHIGIIAQSFLPVPAGWIVCLGAAFVYLFTLWRTWLNRRRLGLVAVPVFVVLGRTLLVAAIAVASVYILNRFHGIRLHSGRSDGGDRRDCFRVPIDRGKHADRNRDLPSGGNRGGGHRRHEPFRRTRKRVVGPAGGPGDRERLERPRPDGPTPRDQVHGGRCDPLGRRDGGRDRAPQPYRLRTLIPQIKSIASMAFSRYASFAPKKGVDALERNVNSGRRLVAPVRL
jgi:hypothetical protein